MSRYKAGENLPYFCTITVLDWTPILIEARYIDPIIESLEFSRTNKGLQLFAFVVMPNHLHLICAAGDGVPRGVRDTREGIPAAEGARRDSRTSEKGFSHQRTRRRDRCEKGFSHQRPACHDARLQALHVAD